jgi:amidophosphoribosyltransferase
MTLRKTLNRAARSSSRPATPRSSSTSSRPRPIDAARPAHDALNQVEGAYRLVVPDREGWSPAAIRSASGRWSWAARHSTIFRLGTVALGRHRRQFSASRAGESARRQRTRADLQAVRAGRPAACIFEHVYFSRPTASSRASVYKVRKNIGAELSREAPGRGRS